MSKYRVWECKIVISEDVDMPLGFDSPPRDAAIDAIESYGIEVIDCFSGWGGNLTKVERSVMNDDDALDALEES